MSFNDGVIILSPGDALEIADLLHEAAADMDQVRVAIDDGGVKLSVGRRTWTPAIGRETDH